MVNKISLAEFDEIVDGIQFPVSHKESKL